MTTDQRKKLIDAAVASWLENFNNGPTKHEVFVELMLRKGHRGYEQMTDEELLESISNEIGYDSADSYDEEIDDPSTEKLRALGRTIRGILSEGEKK